ncbi:TPD1 protein 1-like isoform X2 [Tripterygium wilfordii]|uniref:TPD1 protein 1-like isoform X2 n=1 Tax=Tripterygium wilfordii TaxID=458696 RepID=A0A7J7D923_TRIWF|nr:TPD1 protein 1-like isoform X2 [Tripterygium wilfordii]
MFEFQRKLIFNINVTVVQLIREKETFGQELGVENSHSLLFSKDSRNRSGSSTTIAFTRKLLQSPGDDGNRIGTTCSKNDIVIFQGSAAPLPNGIPSYTVQILNVCVSGCSISNIHVSCGWFSTVRMINPRVFRRVYYDDCLVNDGEALGPGESLSFDYANSYSYHLSVSSVVCC